MIDGKTASLHATFSVDGEVSNDDIRFLKVVIDLMHTGENLNGSYFSKEVVDECVDSIKNTPVLGFIKYDSYTKENDFKGHEYVIKRTENGVEQLYAGHAYGVIPETCNPRWYTKMCDDGVEREFLQVDALLWEKFSDATGILKRDSEKAESMEIEVSSIEGYDDEEDGLFHFQKFLFNGACLLGEGVEPAMTGASVSVNEVNYSVSDFVKNLQDELNDKFAVFTKLIDKQNEQGGVKNMPEDIKNDEMIEDVNPDFSENVDDNQTASDDTKTASDFSNTMMQQFNDISNIVSSQEIIKNKWGYDAPRYYAVDIQDDEVIVVDTNDNYNYYGIPYTIDGDKPVLDFACGTRKKIRYEDYEDGAVTPDGAFSFSEHISAIEKSASDKIENIEAEYSKVKAEFDEIKPKYDEYVAAEAEREAAEINAAKDAKFAEFDDVLGENVEFVAIKEKRDELSVDEIEKECAVLYVKAARAAKANFSKNSGSAVVGIMNGIDNDVLDGYVSTKYGYIKKHY